MTTPPDAPAPPPMPGPGAMYEKNELAALLKAPGWLLAAIEQERGLASRSARMLAWGIVLHSIFGLAMALFGGWTAASMALVKVPLIGLCSAALCLPSLYVFACVGGMPLRIAQAVAIAASVFALTGLLLVGLAPVVWLFAVSTNHIGFVVMLDLLAWIIALGFVLSFIGKFRDTPTLNRTGGLRWWVLIYVLVTLQMATTMRPLLVQSNDGAWWAKEKKFFLVQFFDALGSDVKPAR